MIRHFLNATVANLEKGLARIVVAPVEVVGQLEEKLFELGHPVVRTRIQDQNIWRALQHAGVTVLVERDQPVIQFVGANFALEELKDSSIDAILHELGFERPAIEERP
jgi:TRAP-type uncharacterized transport system substrate-binding protein